jgi:hypothetical protein
MREFSVDDMQIRSAHAARVNADQQLASRRLRIGHVALMQHRSASVEHHCAHVIPSCVAMARSRSMYSPFAAR